ncbi:MAG: S1 RNA-binding domain-containing protein, partial [Actinomycetota bacterium]|nr:S1 RNA-binding domain-containing protein [Actinomycetota bacterium]
TGADITVDDAEGVGTVTIGAKASSVVDEARRRIDQILNPPKAQVGDVYAGKVVNITKFGAFVNILPGRDGLLHISKLGKGKRVERVEDVLELGAEITVRVDDIDPQGKVALSVVSDDVDPDGDPQGEVTPSSPRPAPSDEPRPSAGSSPARSSGGSSSREYVSFEDSFEQEAREAFGDLGPSGEAPAAARSGGGGDADGPRRNRDRRRRR